MLCKRQTTFIDVVVAATTAAAVIQWSYFSYFSKQLCCCSVLCPCCAADVMSSSRTNETKSMNYLSDCFSLISPNSFFFFFQKFAYISFETDSNIAENSIFLVRAWLAVKAVKYIEVFFVYGCINVRMKFGNCYWTNLLSILYSGC